MTARSPPTGTVSSSWTRILRQGAGDRGRDLGVDLVGGDLEQRLVDLDRVALGLEPAGDGALGDGLAERRHGHRLAASVTRTAGRAVVGARAARSRLCLGLGGGLLRGLLGRGSLGRRLVGLGGRLLLGGLLTGVLLAAVSGRGTRVAGAAVAAVTDDGEVGADGDGVVLFDQDLLQDARDGRGDLGVDLVGGHLEQRLVDLDRVADVLQPARHGAFGDATHPGPAWSRVQTCASISLFRVRWQISSRSSCGRAGACRRVPGAPRRGTRSASGGRGSARRRRRAGPPSCR